MKLFCNCDAEKINLLEKKVANLILQYKYLEDLIYCTKKDMFNQLTQHINDIHDVDLDELGMRDYIIDMLHNTLDDFFRDISLKIER